MNLRPSSVLTIQTVMTPFPVTVSMDDSLEHVRGLMETRKIRHLPVLEKGVAVGVVSERDLNLAASVFGGSNQTAEIVVRDVCTLAVYKVEASTPLKEVLSHMVENHIGSTLVEKDGRLAGIFTLSDACAVLLELIKDTL